MRADYLFAEHERLNNHLRYSPSLSFQEQQEIREKIDYIENHNRYEELTAAGFTTGDLNPYIAEIQSIGPREGIVAERDEALSEIVREATDENIEVTDVVFGPIGGRVVDVNLEIAEGGFEIGREVGEAAYNEAAETVGEGIDAVEELWRRDHTTDLAKTVPVSKACRGRLPFNPLAVL